MNAKAKKVRQAKLARKRKFVYLRRGMKKMKIYLLERYVRKLDINYQFQYYFLFLT